MEEAAPVPVAGRSALQSLQRALLPALLPEVEGLPLSARHLPGEDGDRMCVLESMGNEICSCTALGGVAPASLAAVGCVTLHSCSPPTTAQCRPSQQR